MNPKQESERFLSLAYADRDACRALTQAKGIQPHIICFHVQQAIEKILKAVMLSHEIPFRRTHDLSECALLLQDIGLTLPVSVEQLADLTPYAVIGRYGGIEDDIIAIDEALEMMDLIFQWASDYL